MSAAHSAMRRQRGFSLVEVMVAITLSMIVLAGVLAVMYSSRVTYLENDRVARIQEGGRAAVEMMLRDLRGAGFPGCAQPIAGLFDMNNILTNPTDTAWNLTQPVFGYDGSGGTWTPALDSTLIPTATVDNDVIVVRSIPAGAPSMRVSAMVNPTTDPIAVDRAEGEILNDGEPAVISDCANATIFVVDTFTADGDVAADISRTSAGATLPTNTTTNLGAAFQPGARIAPIRSVAYFVAPDASGMGTSLWRVVHNRAPEEIVPGVEAMQVQYGVDTNNNMTVDEYVDADVVADWAQVIAVSIAVLVRSTEQNSPGVDTRTYSLLGTDVGPFNDRFQRSLFTTTVTLRNRTT